MEPPGACQSPLEGFLCGVVCLFISCVFVSYFVFQECVCKYVVVVVLVAVAAAAVVIVVVAAEVTVVVYLVFQLPPQVQTE